MSNKIKPKKVKKTIRYDLGEAIYVNKITYSCSMTDDNHLIDSIVKLLRTAKSVTIELANDVLPELIMDELKWLNYYQFNAHITVKNKDLFEKYHLCSKEISISQMIDHNLLIIRFQNSEIMFFIDNLIKRAELLVSNISSKELDNKQKDLIKGSSILSFNESSEFMNMDMFKQTKKFLLMNLNSINLANDEVNKFECLFYKDDYKLDKEYILIEDKIYELVRIRNRIFIIDVINPLNTLDFFKRTTDRKNADMVINNGEPVHLIKDETKKISIDVNTQSFDAYLNYSVEKDIHKIMSQNPEYELIEFECLIHPPLLKEKPGYSLAIAYSEVHKKISKYVEKVKKDFNKAVMIQEKSQLKSFYVEMYSGLDLLSTSHDIIQKIQNIATSLSSYDHLVNEIKDRLVADFKQIEEYSNLPISQIVETINTQMESLLKFDKTAVSNKAINSTSLSRIINLSEADASKYKKIDDYNLLIRSISDTYYGIKSMMKIISKFNFPSVGVLYEKDGEQILVIEYEDQIEQAICVAKEHEYDIFVKGE